MVAQLTKNERQVALIILLAISLWGLAMAVAGRGDPLGVHGAIVLLAGIAGTFGVISGYYAPEPDDSRLDRYFDDPSRMGIILAMVWVVAGLFVGDWIAWQLVNPNLTFDAAWSSFGRLRPVHTSGVIFGFGGNALIATSFYVLQRTSRARLPDQLTPWFVLLGYNLFCVLAATGYLMGVTQSKEYAEPEWYADIWLDDRVGHLFRPLSAHAGSPQGAAYLRVELVLHGLHPGRGDAPHRQQPRHPGFDRSCQELFGIFRRAGCDDAVVVRA